MMIAKHVRKLDSYVPGEQPKSLRAVKLNTNENPYPPSPAVARALAAFDTARLRRYCDPDCSALRAALAKLNRTTPDRVFVGNGSDEILALTARAFVENDETIGSLDPSYSLYRTLAAIRDVSWRGFPHPAGALGEMKKAKTSLFLWTNPNAPTGEFVEPDEIAAFAAKFPGVVLVDEAYADFARTNAMTLATAEDNRNVIVLRTFSKSFSLAGLRVGYCVGPRELIDALFRLKDSYNVDGIAQAVALAAVRDVSWMRANTKKVIATRAVLTDALAARGWDVIPSESNFLFARPPKGDAARVFAALKARNIFVRYFPGPKTGERLRITVGTDAETAKLLKALDAIS